MLRIFLQVMIPNSWKATLPVHEHAWISQRLFKMTKNGPKLKDTPPPWIYPTQPKQVLSGPPSSSSMYFARPMFLWFPHRHAPMSLVPVLTDSRPVSNLKECSRHRWILLHGDRVFGKRNHTEYLIERLLPCGKSTDFVMCRYL